MKSPYPYFGGKERVADVVWDRFGRLDNYCEPFFGSGAILLNRPSVRGLETINDLNGWVVNFWRAIKADPEGVAKFADYPVSEIDLQARAEWLFYSEESKKFVETMKHDPDFFDIKIAGWWVWGKGSSYGGDFVKKKMGRKSKGKAPKFRPEASTSGKGIQRTSLTCGNFVQYLDDLSIRMRDVRIFCGEWDRILGYTQTTLQGITGVFLDPPYDVKDRDAKIYGKQDSTKKIDSGFSLSGLVRKWCIENGSNPLFRIAIAGYDTEHVIPEDWETFHWKTSGGMGNTGKGQGIENKDRERIWFSPHCLRQPSLYELFKD